MWPQRNLVELLNTLVVDPGLDQIGGEDAAAEEIFVVHLQGIQNLEQGTRRALDLVLELRLELVEVFVDRLGELYLIAQPVETGHQTGSKRQVGIAGRLRSPELQPLLLGTADVHGDSHAGAAVALR